MKRLEGWELRAGILITLGVALAILALMIIVSPPGPATDDRAKDLAAKWTVSVGALVFGMVSFAVGALHMTAHLPGEKETAPWILALVPVIAVVVFVFWVNNTIHPPSAWLPSDPRRQPSHMLAAILLSGFFGAIATAVGSSLLLTRFLRGRAR